MFTLNSHTTPKIPTSERRAVGLGELECFQENPFSVPRNSQRTCLLQYSPRYRRLRPSHLQQRSFFDFHRSG